MCERPIIFTASEVRAALAGRKTQHRVPAKFIPIHPGLNFSASSLQPGHYVTGHPLYGFVLHSIDGSCWNDRTLPLRCPLGVPGDRLWVKETYWPNHEERIAAYRADGEMPIQEKQRGHRWHSPMTMPRWASRLTLEITSVGIQRLRDIREADAIREGIEVDECHHVVRLDDINWGGAEPEYLSRWNRRHPKFTFQSNPWVWVVELRRAK